MITWDALPVFLAVADSGSQSGAARRLRISQPTVGRQLDRLEADLGCKLFDRTPQGLQLTADGENLLPHAQRMNEEALAAQRGLQGADSRLSGLVRISASEGFASHWLTPAMKDFATAHPGIKVEVVSDNFAVNLPRRDADIALRMFRPEHNDLIGRHLATHVVGFFASESYVKENGAPQSMVDLKNHALVGFDESLSHLPQALLFAKTCPRENFSYRANSLLAQLHATRCGWGIGAHSCIVASGEPGLKRVLPDVDAARQEVWLVVHADVRRSARIRAVYDFLADLIVSQRPALEGKI